MEVISFFGKALYIIVLVSSPFVISAVISGFTISLLQSVIQVQDQTLPFAVKLLSIITVCMVFGRWVINELVIFLEYSYQLASFV